jgi:drug/metabolite transporter (DMT)-like permease
VTTTARSEPQRESHAGFPTTARTTPLTIIGLVLVVSILWGLTYPVSRVAMQHSPPLFFAMARTAIGGALIIATAMILGRPPPISRRSLAVLGVAGVLNYSIFYGALNVGIQSLSAGEVAVLNYTMPLWMALIAWVALGQRLGMVQVLGLLLGFIGVLGVVAGDLSPRGGSAWQAYATVLTGAVSWAAGSLLFVRLAQGVALEWAVGIQSLIGSLVLLIAWLGLEGGRLPDGSAEFWLPFAFVALLAAFVAQLAYFSLLRRRESTVVGAYVFLVPVVGATSGILLLGEPMSLLKAGGALCVLAGIALVNRQSTGSLSNGPN